MDDAQDLNWNIICTFPIPFLQPKESLSHNLTLSKKKETNNEDVGFQQVWK